MTIKIASGGTRASKRGKQLVTLLIFETLLAASVTQAALPGGVVAWGDNSYGQTIVPVMARSGVLAIAAG